MEDNEIYDLKYVLAEFIYPRLKVFKAKIDNKQIISIPDFDIYSDLEGRKMNTQQLCDFWAEKIAEMIFSFEYCLYPERFSKMNEEEAKEKYQYGLIIFAKYFNDLWI
ncbi:hypothetical protein [Epilithonimonas mollis]|uniref:Uncharacterized protein n=1 Tax=Epilithonimonas mollis TaxID=216903 RepID=A0A1M6TKK2_9FLAO|nr:hypothetical protein [Epilithonimonas mollis]SHK57436.1 hypothetical protein SAMN05444371_2938 [Epilithonimonas mollis]